AVVPAAARAASAARTALAADSGDRRHLVRAVGRNRLVRRAASISARPARGYPGDCRSGMRVAGGGTARAKRASRFGGWLMADFMTRFIPGSMATPIAQFSLHSSRYLVLPRLRSSRYRVLAT